MSDTCAVGGAERAPALLQRLRVGRDAASSYSVECFNLRAKLPDVGAMKLLLLHRQTAMSVSK